MRVAATAAAAALLALGGGAAAVLVQQEETAGADASSDYTLAKIDEGVAALKHTSISYPQWLSRSYAPGVRETTAWGRAFAAFDAAKRPPPLPPPTAPSSTAPTTAPPPTTTTTTTTTEPVPGGALYVSTSGTDASACSEAAPCLTWQRAYAAANPGQAVLVAAGSYPPQTLKDVPTKTAASAPVAFRPYNGPVSVPLLDLGNAQTDTIGPKQVSFADMEIRYTRAWAGTDGLRLERIRGLTFDLDARNAVVRDGDFGPCQVPRDLPSPCVSRIAGTSRNVLVEGNAIHGMTSTDLGRFHVDGMAVFGGESVTIRRNRFYGNMITHIRVQNCCGNLPLRGLVVEGNTFDKPLNGQSQPTNANGVAAASRPRRYPTPSSEPMSIDDARRHR